MGIFREAPAALSAMTEAYRGPSRAPSQVIAQLVSELGAEPVSRSKVAQALGRVPAWSAVAGGTDGPMCVGGMASKIQAARKTARFGIPTLIACGTREGILHQILKGKEVGTLILPKKRALSSRKHWIVFNVKAKGEVFVDDGADITRILTRSASTLPQTGNRWLSATADLTPFDGKQIRLKFSFNTGVAIDPEGWYVDDIEIIGANSRAQNVLATTLLRRVPRIASDDL